MPCDTVCLMDRLVMYCVDMDTFFVTWQKLILPEPTTTTESSTSNNTGDKNNKTKKNKKNSATPLPSMCPPAREMHSTCQYGCDKIIISGGMSQHTNTRYDDIWVLSVTPLDGQMDQTPPLQWNKLPVTLPMTLFGHSAAMTENVAGQVLYCVIGGISGECVVENMLMYDFSPICHPSFDPSTDTKSTEWTIVKWYNSVSPVHFRMGFSFLSTSFSHCIEGYSNSIPTWLYKQYISDNNTLANYTNTNTNTNTIIDSKLNIGESDGEKVMEPDHEATVVTTDTDASSGSGGEALHQYNSVVLFGGVDMERDYHDLWLFVYNPVIDKGSNDANSTGNSGLVSVLG